MVYAVSQAQKRHRSAIEALYDGECRIYEQVPVPDPLSKVTRFREVQVADHMACRLSFAGMAPVSGDGMKAVVSQSIQLFLSPEIYVKPGSRIEVTRRGKTESYCRSGKAAVYASHQELFLDIWKGYA